MVFNEDARKDIEEVVVKHAVFSCCARDIVDRLSRIQSRIISSSSKETVKKMVLNPFEEKYLPSAIVDIVNKYVSGELDAVSTNKLLSDKYFQYNAIVNEQTLKSQQNILEYQC